LGSEGRSRRRDFVTLIGSVSAAWPLPARAQQPAMPVIGFLHSASPSDWAPSVAAFLQGLKEIGYVEGHNVAIEYRWAEGHYDRVPELAADLVRRQVTVIFASPGPAALPAKNATATIPIVFAIGTDPVKFGLVASFNRPGSNITGVSWLGGPLLTAKRLEMLHEAVPDASAVAVLVNPNNPLAEVETTQAAARTIGLQLQLLKAGTERDIDIAFATLVERRIGALLVATDGFLFGRRNQLVALAKHHAVPAMYSHRQCAVTGGLMSYDTSLTDADHQAGLYVGRILKGAKPADLPVQQQKKVELVVNLNDQERRLPGTSNDRHSRVRASKADNWGYCNRCVSRIAG
jgi:putative tryptophan/tyrosine transport system substrate-binding protein